MNATKEEWIRLNEYFSSIDWNVVLACDDIDKNCDNLINILEIGVKRSMRKLINDKTIKNASGHTYKSSNLIPKEIRTLFKRKGKLSKSYRKVKTINRCVSLRRKILDIDIKLKNHYESKQLLEEMK